MKINKTRIFIVLVASFFLVGFIIPEKNIIPVQNATVYDWDHDTFWAYPWGKSKVHKGIDIFAKSGTIIKSSTLGLCVFTGNFGIGGKAVIILGPKWRFHYYAHMSKIKVKTFRFINYGTPLGNVGDSGNAKGKPPHLHYSIFTPIPHIWQITNEVHGYRKAFYINPHDLLIKNKVK